uniref:Uncharacterized protein n=1 Tax=Arundo donax TaxID=35708 RepID=A0A0A9FEM1_ARUDO
MPVIFIQIEILDVLLVWSSPWSCDTDKAELFLCSLIFI